MSAATPSGESIKKEPSNPLLDKSNSWEDRYIQSGFFNISSMAQAKLMEKRKRKGLGAI